MSEKKKIFKRIRNSAVIKNPLLFEAVGLCPVVAIALSLRLALFLALVTAIEMAVCEVLASLMLKNVRRYWRVALYVIFGTAIIYPIMYVTGRFFPDMSMNFGIYLPLMAVNSLVALHCERVAVKNNVTDSLVDALSASLSYGAVTVIVGFVRELLALGTIGGADIHLPVKFPALIMPFGGLLIMGFLAAALKAVISVKYPNASPDRAFDTSEIRRSLKGSFKELMNDDYNPYGEDGESDTAVVRIERKQKDKKADKKKEKPPRREKTVKKEKPKTHKSAKKQQNEAQRSEAVRRTPKAENGRTYLDDFSDMLTELEEYKTRSDNTEDKGGDGQ